MHIVRVLALVKRNLLLTLRGLDPLVDYFYWPLFDIVVWGFAARWMAYADTSGLVAPMLLSSLVMWQISYRCSMDISYNLLAEFWSRGFVSLCATPLTINEWLVSAMCLGLLNAFIASAFGTVVVWLLYHIWIPSYGWSLFLFIIPLLISGWVIGLITASCLIYYGERVQKLVWVMGWFFVPFSAVFYPVNSLPIWARGIASCIPMSYIIEGLRIFIQTNQFSRWHVGVGYVMSISYLIVMLVFFNYLFEKSRIRGLARLED